jgi:hypothetical protein
MRMARTAMITAIESGRAQRRSGAVNSASR